MCLIFYSYQFVGDPVIGTVPNLLDYRDRVNCPSNPFHSYTNKVAPFAERAIADGVAERAGFRVWDGDTNAEITDKQVEQYGLAMMIITATDPGQSTCDEPNQPTPHQPPQESEGNCTIIKSYREIMPDATKQDRGTYSRSGVSNNILIENETDYKVIGWKTSTTGNTTISSIGWETSVPSLVGESGTSPTTVELPTSHKYLYVLLEKGEPEEEEELDVNYILTQSTIARHITLNNPDAWTPTMEKLADVTFKWALPAVSDTCSGHSWSHSGSLDGCTNQGTRSCNCGRTPTKELYTP